MVDLKEVSITEKDLQKLFMAGVEEYKDLCSLTDENVNPIETILCRLICRFGENRPNFLEWFIEQIDKAILIKQDEILKKKSHEEHIP